MGLGATVALFSDIIIPADDIRIGDPHVRIGVVACRRGWCGRLLEHLLEERRLVSDDEFLTVVAEIATPAANAPKR